MRRLLFGLIMLLVLFAFVGCSEQMEVPVETPAVDVEAEDVVQVSQALIYAEAGVVFGDILFRDIPISRLFTESFLDVLGEPSSQGDARFLFVAYLFGG